MLKLSTAGIVIDVEASGLGSDSYPIQIGWCSLDKRVQGSLLLQPAKTWNSWDDQAEEVHGIDRADLLNGLPLEAATSIIMDVTQGRSVYCDAPIFDQFWIDTLFASTGKYSGCIQLMHVSALVPEKFKYDFMGELESMSRAHDAFSDSCAIVDLLVGGVYV